MGLGPREVAAMLLAEVNATPEELVIVAQEALGRALALQVEGQPECRWCRHSKAFHSSYSPGTGDAVISACRPPASRIMLTKGGGFKIVRPGGECHCRGFSEHDKSVTSFPAGLARERARRLFSSEGQSLGYLAAQLHTSLEQVIEWTKGATPAPVRSTR